MEQTGASCHIEPWTTLKFGGNVPWLGTILPTATVLADTCQRARNPGRNKNS